MDKVSTKFSNELILVARIVFVFLFLISGGSKAFSFSATVAYMTQVGVPVPTVAAIVAICIEYLSVGLILGVATRPVALTLALFSLMAALIGHPYWRFEGTEAATNFIHFYKDVGLIGGLLLLCATGPGKYSLDAMFGLTEASALSKARRCPAIDALDALTYAARFEQRRVGHTSQLRRLTSNDN
ncbi:DoxX family protein [Ensifer sp. ENS07]|uniref:DoxX family protein n=1 Tax=unclassified Ensifer TaxID=2633371 RepID=UPI001785DBF3|nr:MULTISPECIES: DoxX family protein [unclassified Ensifer]MBD9508122.1 DoxX family protein [Ensifer sp. ENS10]MBD9637382.1 DoxX family protein [Ensifer sp. ENS07]